MKRIRVKRPGQEIFKSEFSEYIQPEELYIGARVNVNGYLFVLLNADEYTLKFMEENSDRVSLFGIILDLSVSALQPVFFFLGAFSSPTCHPFLYCAFTHVGMNNGSA